MMNRLAVFERFGQPEEVLTVVEGPVEAPREGELCVRMLAAPVNPADINYIQGTYGEKTALPCRRTGLEGCGVVVESRAEGFAPGDQVILLDGCGAWCSFLTAPARCFCKLSETLDPAQAAMLKVNPLTAWLVLTQYTKLQPGDWVVQNAANSGVGQCLIQLARTMGLHTLNLVRRAEERRAGLMALGADVVLEDCAESLPEALQALGGARPVLGGNCVGGESATRLMDLLRPGSTMVTFGSMSLKSIKVPNSFLIFRDLCLRGLWCTKWLQNTPAATVHATYARLASLVAQGRLRQAVEAVYTPDSLLQAVQHARRPGRTGKILLRFDS